MQSENKYLEKVALMEGLANKAMSAFGMGRHQMVSKGLLAGAGIGAAAGLASSDSDNRLRGGLIGGALGGAAGGYAGNMMHNKYLGRVKLGLGAAGLLAGSGLVAGAKGPVKDLVTKGVGKVHSFFNEGPGATFAQEAAAKNTDGGFFSKLKGLHEQLNAGTASKASKVGPVGNVERGQYGSHMFEQPAINRRGGGVTHDLNGTMNVTPAQSRVSPGQAKTNQL